MKTITNLCSVAHTKLSIRISYVFVTVGRLGVLLCAAKYATQLPARHRFAPKVFADSQATNGPSDNTSPVANNWGILGHSASRPLQPVGQRVCMRIQ